MMATRLLRPGFFGKILQTQKPGCAGALMTVQTRQSGGQSIADVWDRADKTFYGPERDTKNFPHPKQPDASAPCRLGFIPEEWFMFFYPKTGVTGPYVFTGGLTLFLLSKEIWVVDHGFAEVVGFWGAFIILAKKVGPMMAKWLDEGRERYDEEIYTNPMTKSREALNKTVENCQKAIWQEEGQKHLWDAKRENVDLQLEAIYRQRLQNAYNQVKRRLDYQIETQTTKRQFEQKHMVDWIVKNVVKSITPQQEKDSIAKCIANLKRLAAAQPKAA